MAAPVLAQPLLLGMMRLLEYPELGEPQALLGFIERCVERGLNGFDHADIYAGGQCEAHFGAALRQAPGLRQRLQIIGKADIVPAGRIARAGGSSTTTPVPATCAGRWTPAWRDWAWNDSMVSCCIARTRCCRSTRWPRR